MGVWKLLYNGCVYVRCRVMCFIAICIQGIRDEGAWMWRRKQEVLYGFEIRFVYFVYFFLFCLSPSTELFVCRFYLLLACIIELLFLVVHMDLFDFAEREESERGKNGESVDTEQRRCFQILFEILIPDREIINKAISTA